MQQTEQEWMPRGFSCGQWTDPPGQVWADYVHDSDELVVVVEAVIEFEYEGRVVRPSPWEEVLIPAGISHTVRNVGTTTSRWLYGYKQ